MAPSLQACSFSPIGEQATEPCEPNLDVSMSHVGYRPRSLSLRRRGISRRRGPIAPRTGVVRARQQDRLAAVLEATTALTSSRSIEEMVEHLAGAASQAVGRSHVELYVFSPDCSRVELVCSFGLTDEEQAVLGRIADIPVGQFWAERRAMETLQPVEQAIDTAQLSPEIERWFRQVGKLRTLVTPLLADNQMIGCFDMWTPHDDHPFAPGDVAAAAAVGRQAGLAIQNVRLREGDRQRVREQAALVRVGQAAISGVDLEGVLDTVAKATLDSGIGEACDVELWHREEDVTELVAAATIPEWYVADPIGTRYPLRDWPSTRRALGLHAPQCYNADDARLGPIERRSFKDDQVRSILELPLRVGDENLGILVVYDRAANRFGPREVHVGQELAAQAALAIQNTRLHEALQRQAETDALTGLLNHRAIQEHLDHLLMEGETHAAVAGGAAVLLVDIDDFKLFNDTHGHLIGDQVLRDVARLLIDVAQVGDRAGRYGGDEFLLVLTDAARGENVTEELLRRAAATTISVDGLKLPLRLSIGLASAPRHGTTRAELVAAADSAMYAAKEAGVARVPGIADRALGGVSPAFSALSGLVLAVDRKDRYTKRHSDLVTAIGVAFAVELGLDRQSQDALRIAGPLHDVGKIAVPDAILRKPAPLTDEERAIVERHVQFGVLMVQGVTQDEAVIDAIAHHHERWDGQGYPGRRRGTAIPLLGRILSIVDAYAAMICDRPYRKALRFDRITVELRKGAGGQFDPSLVEPFVEWIEGERWDRQLAPGEMLADEARSSANDPATCPSDRILPEQMMREEHYVAPEK